MFRLILVSFMLSIELIIGQEELKCKARKGCHFSGCDPARWSPDIFDRNEFPITCKQASARSGNEAGVTPPSYQLLLNSHLANTQKMTALTVDVKELSETSTSCLQRLDKVETENRDVKKKLNELEAKWGSLAHQLRKEINQLKEGNDKKLPVISSPAPQTAPQTTTPDLTTRLISTRVTCEKKVLMTSRHYNTTFCPAGKPVGSLCSISCKEDFRFFPYAREWNAACKLQAGNNLKAEWDLDAAPRCVQCYYHRHVELGWKKSPVCDDESVIKFGSTYLTSWSCDFDTAGDLCGMWNERMNKVNWTQRVVKISDAGVNRGLGLEKSSPKDRAVIWSPRLAPGSYCVRFRVFAILTDEEDNFVVYTYEYIHSRRQGSGRPFLWKNSSKALKNNTWTPLEFYTRNVYVDVFMQLQFYWSHLGARSSVVLDDLSVEKGKCKSYNG